MSTVVQDALLHEGSLAGIPLPITLRAPVPLTDDELIAFSRRNRLYRIEQNANGELEIMSPVGGNGSHFEALVIGQLSLWAEQHDGVSFSSNAGFRLPDGSVLSPDAAWVSDDRWNALSREEQRRFAPLCPEFVIEILSESDSRRVLEAKMRLWLANGAQLAWMIDPYAATVSVYRPGSPVEVLERPDFLDAGKPVAGFRLTTSKLWQQ